jgi:hypothetical protein
LEAEGLVPAALAVREPSLDDVFLAITGHPAEAETDSEPDPTPTRGAA